MCNCVRETVVQLLAISKIECLTSIEESAVTFNFFSSNGFGYVIHWVEIAKGCLSITLRRWILFSTILEFFSDIFTTFGEKYLKARGWEDMGDKNKPGAECALWRSKYSGSGEDAEPELDGTYGKNSGHMERIVELRMSTLIMARTVGGKRRR